MYFYQKQTMYLQQNDLVALVSPAGFLSDGETVNRAQKLLYKWGFKSYAGQNILQQAGHFAGNDLQRFADMQKAIDNPDVKMIWALRGGYGSIRIIDELNWHNFKKFPKLLVGFSDITVFHAKLQRMGYESLHAFMPVQLREKISKEVVEQTKNAIKGRSIAYQFNKDTYTVNFKPVSGKVVGGNLAILYSLLGTNLSIDTHDKILFIEDVGEQLYQIDRMLIALKMAGKLKDLRALLVGQFTGIPDNQPSFGKTYQEIILEHTAAYDYPVIFNAPIGHITDNYPLMLGRALHITTDHNKINLLQPAAKDNVNEK